MNKPFLPTSCAHFGCRFALAAALLLVAQMAIVVNVSGATSPKLEWVRQFGTDGQDLSHSVTGDTNGNVFVSGSVMGSLAGPYAGGFSDGFLRKYDSNASVQWTRQFGTDTEEEGRGVSADPFGNVYVSGWTRGNLFEPNVGAEDAYLSKYDGMGNLLWGRQLGSNSNDLGFGVSADVLGNVFITGHTNGDLGDGPAAPSGDVFVTKYNAAGNLIWTRQFGPNAEQRSFGVSADGLGNVYISGWTGNSSIPGGVYKTFLNKYDSDGTLLWTRQLGFDRATSSGVSTDGLGNVYIAGDVTDGVIRTAVFVSKYDDLGNLQWTREFETDEIDRATGLSADQFGYVYVTGYSSGDLAGDNLGGEDAFILKLDGAGDVVWTTQFGSTEQDRSLSAFADPFRNVYIAGHTTGALPGSTPPDSIDAFVAKFSTIPEPGSATLLFVAAMLLSGNSRELTRRKFQTPA
jgi:hypothetical protein